VITIIAPRAEIAVSSCLERLGTVDLCRLPVGPNQGLVVRIPEPEI
jgi:hypothetical protein